MRRTGVGCLGGVIAVLLAGCGQPASSVSAPSPQERAVDAFTGPWAGPDGEPAERGGRSRDMEYELVVYPGPDHCDWQSVAFMHAGWPLGTTIAVGPGQPTSRTFVRDADSSLGDPELQAGLDLDAELPAGSTNTGFQSGEIELWLGPDRGEQYAYLKGATWVERWPHDPEPPGCA